MVFAYQTVITNQHAAFTTAACRYHMFSSIWAWAVTHQGTAWLLCCKLTKVCVLQTCVDTHACMCLASAHSQPHMSSFERLQYS